EAMAAKGMDVRDITMPHQPGFLGNLLRIIRQAKQTRNICLSENIEIVASHHGSIDLYLFEVILKVMMIRQRKPAFVRHFHSVFEPENFRDSNPLKYFYKWVFRQLIGISVRMSDAV